MIIINGEEYVEDEIYLLDFLEENNFSLKAIAIECNEQVIPKKEYDKIVLHSGDVVEIVSFVGGG